MKDTEAVKKRIRERVTLGSFLKRDNITSSETYEEQVACPFHGQDIHKSARFYAETDTLYCWKCKKVWDLFSYLMDKNQLSFSEIVNRLITQFKIVTEDLPDVLEGAIQKRIEHRTAGFDKRKAILEGCYRLVIELRSKVEKDKHTRLVFAYMLLKNNTSEDKFEEMANKVVSALLRLKKK